MRPSLSSADECTAVHVWAQSSLPGCVCANVMMSFFFFFFFFLMWKKAYMSIDANLVSNPKDR